MKKIGLFLLLGVSFSWLVSACQGCQQERRKEVPLDSIVLSDPCILADRKTAMYYMTGTGGMLWKSKDLKLWEGPFHVAKTDSGSWMGPKPMIWAAELHPYKGKYYYFATFTNQEVKIDTVQGNVIERRASHVLVSDNPDGPYVPMKDSTYLPADKPTLDGTFWVDKDGKPYMVYCYEWLQALDGTIEKIELVQIIPSLPVPVRNRYGPSVTLFGLSLPSASFSRLHGDSLARNSNFPSPMVPFKSGFSSIFSIVPSKACNHS